MARAIELFGDLDAADFRRAASLSRDAGQSRRLLALAAVAEGRRREEAARIGGMDRQTLRDWVHRFNADGVDGLIDRKAPGATCKLTAEQRAELADLIETGPDPKTAGVVRWRRVDLREVIRQRFGVTYHERSVSRLLAHHRTARHSEEHLAGLPALTGVRAQPSQIKSIGMRKWAHTGQS